MNNAKASISQPHLIVAYIADLELEVDRLRKQSHFLRDQAKQTVEEIRSLLQASPLAANLVPQISNAVDHLGATLSDMRDVTIEENIYDRVSRIELRPLVEELFRWQRRLLNAPNVVLRLQLETDSINWFPARLEHILDNLISNAIKYRDIDKGEMRLSVAVRSSQAQYELRISDNGVGMVSDQQISSARGMFALGATRLAGIRVGLSVVERLVQQTGGALNIESGDGHGTSILVQLPQFETNDFI